MSSTLLSPIFGSRPLFLLLAYSNAVVSLTLFLHRCFHCYLSICYIPTSLHAISICAHHSDAKLLTYTIPYPTLQCLTMPYNALHYSQYLTIQCTASQYIPGLSGVYSLSIFGHTQVRLSLSAAASSVAPLALLPASPSCPGPSSLLT